MIRLRPSGVDEILIKRVQDWYEPGPGVFIQSLTASFSPAMLFTGSTTGVWYDPSDTTTLFQDAAGTTPVTAVEQPVGLMLDKSKGLVLGSELVTNGDFSTDTWWTKGVSTTISGGAANIAAGSGYVLYRTGVAGVAVGGLYEVTYTVSNYVSGSIRAYVGATATFGPTVSANGTYTTRIGPTAGSEIGFNCPTAFTGSIDNVSIKAVTGNHAFNSSGNSANFPVLSARYNLLTKTEDISAADWGKGNATAASTSSLLETATTGAHSCTLSPTTVAATYIYSVKLKANGRTRFAIAGTASLGGNLGNGIFFDLSTGSYVSGATGTPSITALSDGWYQVTYMWTALAGSGPLGIYLVDSGTNLSYAGDITKGMFIKEADLRVANDALNQPAYQRVNTASDYDTVGFKPYLRFNGTNQWLQTNSIDFTYGDKMFVSAGVRKLSDATLQFPVELSTSVNAENGSFAFVSAAPGVPYKYSFANRGTITVDPNTNNAAYSAPITSVLSGIGNISGDQAILRINGSQAAISTADQGIGNYGNYQMFVGARNGTSFWFNGRLYQMVVAGKQASDAEITSTETYINQKTGAF